MYNPDRLDNFYNKLCKLHKTHIPDWRFGQLCSNFFGWLFAEKGRDMFFIEETQMLIYLEEYLNSLTYIDDTKYIEGLKMKKEET